MLQARSPCRTLAKNRAISPPPPSRVTGTPGPRGPATQRENDVPAGHWFFCTAHKTKWCIGSNLFSSWQHETEEEQRRRYYEMGFDTYQEVKPLPIEMETPHDLD